MNYEYISCSYYCSSHSVFVFVSRTHEKQMKSIIPLQKHGNQGGPRLRRVSFGRGLKLGGCKSVVQFVYVVKGVADFPGITSLRYANFGCGHELTKFKSVWTTVYAFKGISDFHVFTCLRYAFFGRRDNSQRSKSFWNKVHAFKSVIYLLMDTYFKHANFRRGHKTSRSKIKYVRMHSTTWMNAFIAIRVRVCYSGTGQTYKIYWNIAEA